MERMTNIVNKVRPCESLQSADRVFEALNFLNFSQWFYKQKKYLVLEGASKSIYLWCHGCSWSNITSSVCWHFASWHHWWCLEAWVIPQLGELVTSLQIWTAVEVSWLQVLTTYTLYTLSNVLLRHVTPQENFRRFRLLRCCSLFSVLPRISYSLTDSSLILQ